MDARGYCQVRLESSGSGDVQPTERPSPVPHPRRCGVQVAISPSHHGHDLEHWPLHDMLTLGALADAVPLARAHLRQLLSGWGWAELSPDASVVVSELVTMPSRRPGSDDQRRRRCWYGSDQTAVAFSSRWRT